MTDCFVHVWPHDFGDVADVYPLTWQAMPGQFEQHGSFQTLNPMGTSFTSQLYELGHGQPLLPVTDMTPEIQRQLRDLAWRRRKGPMTVQLFGLLDLDSPFGSRRAVENLVRTLQPMDIHIVLHLGVWNPTPREFNQGLKEMTTLGDDVVLGSLFPVTMARFDQARTQKYIDGILHPQSFGTGKEPTLPLEQAVLFAPRAADDQTVYLMANHAMHDLMALEHVLPLQTLPVTLGQNRKVADSLQQRHHHVCLTDSLPAQAAYFGSEMHHPYFESYYQPSSEALLEMLLSPHFGYHQEPYMTTVILANPTGQNLDSLLAHYHKKLIHEKQAHSCHFIEPSDISGHWVRHYAID